MHIFRHRVTKKSKSDYCFKIENDKKAPFFIVAAVEVKFSVVLDSSALYVGEGNEGGQGVQVDIRRDWWQDSTELCSQKCLVGNWKCAIFLRQLPMKVCWNQSLEGQLLETVFGKSTFLTFMRIFQKPKVFRVSGCIRSGHWQGIGGSSTDFIAKHWHAHRYNSFYCHWTL